MSDRIAIALLVLAGASACGGKKLPGEPTAVEAGDPREVVAFEPLYAQNCAGCHGAAGAGGAAIGLAAPGYADFAGEAAIRDVIANGRHGTAMPAFAHSAGGMLGDAQVDALAAGVRAFGGSATQLPPYAPAAPGDPVRGAQAFAAHCASCHGAGKPGGSITDSAFLALVSDQYLRTITVVGRPDVGSPGYRAAGAPMSPDEVTDTVAWMAAQREPFPGQPYPSAEKGTQP